MAILQHNNIEYGLCVIKHRRETASWTITHIDVVNANEQGRQSELSVGCKHADNNKTVATHNRISENKLRVEMCKNHKLFECNHARRPPFLLAKGRQFVQ